MHKVHTFISLDTWSELMLFSSQKLHKCILFCWNWNLASVIVKINIAIFNELYQLTMHALIMKLLITCSYFCVVHWGVEFRNPEIISNVWLVNFPAEYSTEYLTLVYYFTHFVECWELSCNVPEWSVSYAAVP